MLLLFAITGMEGDRFMAALGFVGLTWDGAKLLLLNPGGWMLRLELLGVLRGDFNVTCFAAACAADVGVVGARIGTDEEVGVVGMAVEPIGGDTSTLRLGDLPIGVTGCVGFCGSGSSGSFRGGIL